MGTTASCSEKRAGGFFVSNDRQNGDDENMLEISTLKYEIEDRTLFEIENVKVQQNDRIGLVGKNGSGKTSLLHLIAGKLDPSEGSIQGTMKAVLLPQLKNTDTTKSGGEVTQDYINKAIANKTGLLLADEPTTNLDTEHIEKLEKQLKRWQGPIIIVSHDRAFLDALCTSIWAIEEQKVKVFKGNYTDYTEQRELLRRQHENAYESYIQKKRQLENALVMKEQKAQKATKKPKNVSNSEARIAGAKPYFAKKQKKLQKAGKAIETRLEKLEKVEKLKEAEPIKMNLPDQETLTGRIVIRAENIHASFDTRVLFQEASFHIRGGEKTAIIGGNGVGKTTLIKKIIAGEQDITLSPSLKIGYFSQNLDVLDTEKTILENVSATSLQTETLIRTVLARLHFYREDLYKKVGVLSGGERVKIAFAKIFLSDINTLVLDEPTNYLDIEAVEALEMLLQEYDGTVLFISHDRRFIEHVADRLLILEQGALRVFEGRYEAYATYVPSDNTDALEQELLVIETKITEVLSRLSLEPSEELEQQFQQLLKRKKEISN